MTQGEGDMNHLQQYENARHVLAEIRDYHRRLARLYARWSETVSGERAGLLLDYLRRREENLTEALRRYEEDAPDSVLDSWLQIQYPENLNDFLSGLESAADKDLTLEEVRELAQSADEFLMALLEHVEEVSLNPEIQPVFHNLQEIEREEEKALTRAAASLW